MSKWKDIRRDGTPHDGDLVLMWIEGDGPGGGYIFDGCFIHDYFFTPDGKCRNVQYWMYRPHSPNTKEEAGDED
jgi:hypothetical protein